MTRWCPSCGAVAVSPRPTRSNSAVDSFEAVAVAPFVTLAAALEEQARARCASGPHDDPPPDAGPA